MQILGVCFDFDGVIVDSMPFHLEAWRHAHRTIFEEDLSEDFLNSLVGYSTKAIAAKICELHHKPVLASKLIAKKLDELNRSPEKLRIFPGFFEFVEWLDRKQTPWVVVSNSPRAYIENIFRHHSLPTGLVLGIEDFKRPKPAPDPYLQAIRDFGVKFPDNHKVLVFEDSAHGIRSGSDARATVIGITSSHPADCLETAGAKHCFQDIEAFMQSEFFKSLRFSAED